MAEYRRRERTINGIGALVIAAALMLPGCRGGEPIPQGLAPATSEFELTILDETYIEGGSAAEFKLATRILADEVAVEIAVRGADNLKALICELSYDPLRFDPLSVDKTGALDPTGGYVIEKALALDVEPGHVYYGQILPRPQERSGLDGDAVLAVARFALRPDHAAKVASTPPTNRRSRTTLLWDEEASELFWYYYSSGDTNQDSLVTIQDLTPIGHYWKQVSDNGPFPESDAVSVVDYDSNGEINVADMAALPKFYQVQVREYHVYESQNADDYPESNDAPNGPSAVLVDTIDFDDAEGDYEERLHFTYAVSEPQPGAYYWVRPVDNESAEGTPSTLAGGPG